MKAAQSPILRVVVADDERPARAYLIELLRTCDDVTVVGEASDGVEAVAIIERERPDLALLDLQMPELDGLGVVRMVRRDRMPLVAFVTAYDDYAVRAFEVNAIDYLLKPVDSARLRHTLMRAHERLDLDDASSPMAPACDSKSAAGGLRAGGPSLADAVARIEAGRVVLPLRRIPVRRKDDIVFVPVAALTLVVADGELLHLTTASGERHVITYRLKDLEARLPEREFVRLSRSALVRVDAIQRISPMPGGTYTATLNSGQQIGVSRLRARTLRDELLRL